MVPMKTKVTPFPQRPGPDAVPIDEPLIIFSLGPQRFAIQWTVTELKRRAAEVIPIQKDAPANSANVKPRSK
jgi:hypothetical protein